MPIFRLNGEGGNFSNKINGIRTFAEGEEFPINRKIFHFSNFFKKVGVQKSGGKKVGVKKSGGKKSGGKKKRGVKKNWE